MAESSDVPSPAETESSSNVNDYSAEEKALAKEATTIFRKSNNESRNNYDACLTILKRLLANRPNDPKVLLNKAVVDYLKSDYRSTEEFHQQLVTAAQYTGLPLEKADKLDDVDQVVIFYNYALVLYYQRQYRKADSIISRTVPFSEPLDEYFSRRQSLLYMEILLKLQEVDRVLKHCSSVEKALAHVQDDAGQENHGENRNSNFKSEVMHYKVKALLMNRSMKQAKKEIKSLFGSGHITQPTLFLKAYFEFLRRNSRKAVKIFGNHFDPSKNPFGNGEVDSVMHWNDLGCLHLQLGKHNLGVLYLRKAMKQNDKICQEFQPKKGNNKGNQYSHHQPPLKSYSISCHYQLILNMGIGLLFSGKPLAAFEYLIEVMNIYSRNPRLWLRLAECCIKVHRPNNDVDKEVSARGRAVEKSVGSGIHHKLALGSSVSTCKKPWEESAAMPTPTLEFASLCVRNALLMLPKEPEPNRSSGVLETEEELRQRLIHWAEELRVPVQPAGFLRGTEILCLRNSILTTGAYIALCLSDYLGALSFTEQLLQQPFLTGAQWYLGRMYRAEAMLYMDRITDALPLLNSEIVDSVSVTLDAGSGVNAASGASTGASASMSAEEANNNVGGALDGNTHGDDQPGHSAGGDGETTSLSLRWEPSTVAKARGMMMYNMAAAYAVREEYFKARAFVSKAVQLTGMPLPAQFYFLRLYVDLMIGDRCNAQMIIKDMYGHLSINQRNTFRVGNRNVVPNYPVNQSE